MDCLKLCNGLNALVLLLLVLSAFLSVLKFGNFFGHSLDDYEKGLTEGKDDVYDIHGIFGSTDSGQIHDIIQTQYLISDRRKTFARIAHVSAIVISAFILLFYLEDWQSVGTSLSFTFGLTFAVICLCLFSWISYRNDVKQNWDMQADLIRDMNEIVGKDLAISIPDFRGSYEIGFWLLVSSLFLLIVASVVAFTGKCSA